MLTLLSQSSDHNRNMLYLTYSPDICQVNKRTVVRDGQVGNLTPAVQLILARLGSHPPCQLGSDRNKVFLSGVIRLQSYLGRKIVRMPGLTHCSILQNSPTDCHPPRPHPHLYSPSSVIFIGEILRSAVVLVTFREPLETGLE